MSWVILISVIVIAVGSVYAAKDDSGPNNDPT